MRANFERNGVEIVAEGATLAAARANGAEFDAYVMAVAPPAASIEPLTPRELEVLDLLATGLPNQGIAARLGISEATVKFHVAQICAKLFAENRTEAVTKAVRNGLVVL